MNSLSEIKGGLQARVGDPNEFKTIDTRIMLRTGISLMYFAAKQNRDQQIIDSVLEVLSDLGLKLDGSGGQTVTTENQSPGETANTSGETSSRAHNMSAISFSFSAEAISNDLIAQLGSVDPVAVIIYSPHTVNGRAVCKHMQRKFANAAVVGCTTAGVFTESAHSDTGTTCLALPKSKVVKAASTVVSFQANAEQAVREGCRALSNSFEEPLRNLDPKKHVGILLVDGMSRNEEIVNATLGNEAPKLNFVGGSAGDGGEFRVTRVFDGATETNSGAALLLLEVSNPFEIIRSCSFEQTKHELNVTRANHETRTIYEFNNRPAVDVYSELVKVDKKDLKFEVFKDWPIGLIFEDKPWIRSVMQTTPDDGLQCACAVREGMNTKLMHAVDLIDDTHREVRQALEKVGSTTPLIIAFNCWYRKIDIEAKGQMPQFLEAFEKTTTVGFHSYGESWLDHMNQTLTALVLG